MINSQTFLEYLGVKNFHAWSWFTLHLQSLEFIVLPVSGSSKISIQNLLFWVTGSFLMHFGIWSSGNWSFIGVGDMTCRFLLYHPSGIGVALTPPSNENICRANLFVNNFLPNTFRCSPCFINSHLLLSNSSMLTCLKTRSNTVHPIVLVTIY